MVRLLLAAALAALCMTAGAEGQPTPTQAVLDWAGGPVNNLSCGIPPIPPIGCRVGDCVCDQNGNNCRWSFVCG